LFLPLAHVLARHLEILTLASGMTIGFAPSPATLPADLKSFKPHWMIAVPRVLEAFYNTAEARAGGGVKLTLFQWSASVSRRVAQARQNGTVGPLLALKSALADRLVLHKIREAMGGQMRFIVCGGARLSPQFGFFYTGLGVNVLEGYGLTESSAPTTCNPQFGSRIGTVGMPLPGCSVRNPVIASNRLSGILKMS
jgi:long-chain acyl-CoA synthetase